MWGWIGISAIEQAIQDLLSGMRPAQRILHLPKSETSELLVTMVFSFVNQCLANAEHGLDSYLSMRIRHGADGWTVTSSIGTRAYNFSARRTSDEYQQNEYWISIMSSQLSSSDLEFIDARMRKFFPGKGFWISLIDRFAADYIQVQSPEKPKGLFDIPITHKKTIRDIIAEIEAQSVSSEYSGCMLRSVLESFRIVSQ